MTPTQIAVTIAVGVGPTLLCLAILRLLMWLDRPARVTRQQLPAEMKAVFDQIGPPPGWAPPDDLTALADVLVVDPPATRLYVVPDPACRAPDVVIVGTAKVHRQCRDLRRDGRPDDMCNHCAPLLARSATEVQW